MTFATLHTTLGPIRVELFDNHAPKTVRNFIGLAEGTTEYTNPVTNQPGSGPWFLGQVQAFDGQLPGSDGCHGAGQALAGAVRDVDGFADGDPFDGDGVAGLGALEDEGRAGDLLVQGAWGGEEDRVTHRYRLPSRSRSLAKTPPLAASFPSVRCSPRCLASWRRSSSWT